MGPHGGVRVPFGLELELTGAPLEFFGELAAGRRGDNARRVVVFATGPTPATSPSVAAGGR